MEGSFKDEDSARVSSESLLEHQIHNQSRPRRQWNWWKFSLITAAIFVACVEMIVLETIFVHLTAKDGCPPALLGELNNLVPEFSLAPVLFRKDPGATIDDASAKSRNETRDDWLSYMPLGNGFIAVDQAAKYKLPGPIQYDGKDVYSVAVFHQMHCLYAIMDKYNDLTGGAIEGQGENSHPDHDHRRGLAEHEHNHVNHCFRYLRQSLLCCGDTALEGQNPNSEHAGTDGTGAVHMCKDFEAIRSWAEDNRVVDNKHV